MGRVLAASLIMGGAIVLVTQSAGTRPGSAGCITVAAGGIAGILTYLLAARLLGVREFSRFISAVLGRSRAV